MINFEQRRDFGEKINTTFSFLTENARGLGLSLLCIVGPVSLIGGILSGYVQAGLLGSALTTKTIDQLMSYYGRLLSGGGLIGGVFQLVGYVLVGLVTYSYINLYQNRSARRIGVGDVWTGVQPFIGSGLLLTIAVFVIIAFVSVLMIVVLQGVAQTISSLPVIMTAFAVLMLPVVYVMVALSLATAILVFERVSVGKAISRSFRLITDHWWATFGLLLVMTIITFVIGIGFSIPAGIIGGLFGAGVLKEITLLTTVATAFNSLASAFLQAILVTVIAVQYFNLIELKEGSSLDRAVDQIGQAPVADDRPLSVRRATEEEGDY